MENARRDWFEVEDSLAEKLAEGALRDRLAAGARNVGDEGRYEGVEEYDPVLRSHCRLTG